MLSFPDRHMSDRNRMEGSGPVESREDAAAGETR